MEQLRRLVAETIGVPLVDVGVDTGPLNTQRWDSFGHIALMVALEETYRIQLSPDDMMTLLTVGDIARMLRDRGLAVDGA